MSEKHILVVDDSAETRSLLQALLSRAGYTVEVAGDGAEAVRRIGERSPALILMDLQMPGMDGWDAVDALQSSAPLAAIPVAAISGGDLHQCRNLLRERGFRAYLPKPLRFDVLLEVVERCLAGEAEWVEA